MKTKKMWIIMGLLVLICMVLAPEVLARDLVGAASSAQQQINRIAVGVSGLGITIGGLMFAVGMAAIGRMLLFSGCLGVLVIVAAPSIIQLIEKLF